MPFKIGDRVRAKPDRNYKLGVGTLISITYDDRVPEPWCYISWDKPVNIDTYPYYINDTRYTNVYGLYACNIELVSSVNTDPNLPADPRLRGIALKIRDMETRFKDRHNTYEYLSKERVLSDFQRSKVCTG